VGKYSEEFSKTEESHINYSYLKWKQIKEMYDSSLVEIGSHTYNCHSANIRKGIKKLKNESLKEYEEFLKDDISRLNSLLNEINIKPVTFTYPFGYTDKNSLKIIKDMGFKASLGCEEGINIVERDNPECLYNLKRYNRPAGISAERFFKKIL
jgi:peptidoglycan/xylan/chitin deacetylase (PgdA/CDA1 family)